MSKFNTILKKLRERKERVLSGKYNCIPLPFPRFSAYFPGIEKGKYLCITSQQKIGKSKFCDYMFIYEPLFFMMEHPEMKVKVLYFSLEMSPEEKYCEFLCHLLFRLDNIVISPTELRSTDRECPVDERIFELLCSDRYQAYINKFEEMVIYIDDIRNPTGINKYCREYAHEHGHLNYTLGKKKNPVTDEWEDGMVIDTMNPYTPDDEEEYRVIILDNAANIATEKSMDKREAITKMSEYAIMLRNNYKYIFVLIQHQAQMKEGLDNFKANKIKPSSDGMGDAKTVVRDVNMLIGLYSPSKYGYREYEGYDLTKFKDNIRFMEVIEDRDYGANGHICPLYFNGAVSTFKELPKADDRTELQKVYNYIQSVREHKVGKNFFIISLKGLHKRKKFSTFRSLFNIKSK